jgi:alanine dehydrogenase
VSKKISVGFPIMREEPGEKRVFLPDFTQKLTKIGFEIFIEEGYGNSLDFYFDNYKNDNPSIHPLEREEVFKQDYVLTLRSPHDDEFALLGKNSCLISMLHYPTRPLRQKIMGENNVQAISLDSIVDDFNVRLVENMRSVAWNGLEAAYTQFEKYIPNLIREDGSPWKVLVLGTGMVGKQAMEAASKLGKKERNYEHIRLGGPGAIVTAIGRNITHNKSQMIELLAESDIVVDATQRYDPSKPIIPNEWIAYLPEHAIIVDLSADPYTLDSNPPVVKGIEGIPHGNLNQFVFEKDSPNWEKTIPQSIPTANKRKTISCYSWPGIHPESCMRHYGQQLLPLMQVLYKKNYHTLSPDGLYFERALFRARLDSYLKKANQKKV